MAEAGPTPFRRRARVVAVAKVVLPLLALALLATLFLAAREPSGPREIPFARIEDIARDPRVERPRLAGAAADGTAVTLVAERLIPEAGGGVRAVAPEVEARSPDGRTMTLTAPEGRMEGDRLTLAGPVRLTAVDVTLDAAGAAGAVVDVGLGTADLAGPLVALGPVGRIEAGRLRVTRDGAGAARLRFDGGVRVVYQPPDR